MDAGLLSSIIEASGTIAAGIIVGVFSLKITHAYQREKDKQDKDAQWRTHAIELTKLDMDRKIKLFEKNPELKLRPCILDFLANYRDLSDLSTSAKNAKALYLEILDKRIQDIGKAEATKEETA